MFIASDYNNEIWMYAVEGNHGCRLQIRLEVISRPATADADKENAGHARLVDFTRCGCWQTGCAAYSEQLEKTQGQVVRWNNSGIWM